MADYDNTNSGALFVAKEKRTPKSPDFTGSINIEGVEYFLSGWNKVARSGSEFLSLAVTKKTGGQSQGGQSCSAFPGQGGGQSRSAFPGQGGGRQSQSEPPMDFDDDIPF